MIDQQSVERAAERFTAPEGSFERLTLRRDRKRRNQRIRAGVLGIAIAIAVGWVGVNAIWSTAPVPADPPEPSADLGIFEPIAGRIVYYSNSRFWAVDPNAPSPVSTLENFGPEGPADAFTMPLGWSRNGTELLFVREDPTDDTFPYDRLRLYILHADGTETQVIPEPVEAAAISPDGSRVVFTADALGDGLYIVDADGGQPVRITETGEEPTFSPDGTQIAFLGLPRLGCCVEPGREHVWIANADGTDAHEILTDEPALDKGVFDIEWSPAGDRIAMANSLGRRIAIYTFAPDGSDFTKVIDGGANAFWSPDGSQIAYELLDGSGGLTIADANGSNIRSLSLGSQGPWHPGPSTPAPDPDETTGTYNGPCMDSQEGPPGQVCLGPLDEGTYTSQRFEPALTFTVPAGWNNVWDTRGAFGLWAPGWSDDGVDQGPDCRNDPIPCGYLFDQPGMDVRRDPRPIWLERAGADEGCMPRAETTVGTSALEVAMWVANHPAIATEGPSPVEVGGLTGYLLDVSLAEAWREGCPEPRAVWLFEDLYLRDQIPEYGTARLILLDQPDSGSILIWIDGGEVDAAMPVVSSFEFDLD